MAKKFALLAALVFLAGGGWYFMRVRQKYTPPEIKPQELPPLSVFAQSEVWQARVDAAPGLLIEDTEKFRKTFLDRLRVAYWPSPQAVDCPDKFRESVVRASAELAIKYTENSQGLEASLNSLEILAPGADERMTRIQHDSPRNVWRKIQKDPRLTFFRTSPEDRTYFRDQRPVPGFVSSIPETVTMAELRLDIVSKDGETGEINSYFYRDDKGLVHYLQGATHQNSTIFLVGNSGRQAFRTHGEPLP